MFRISALVLSALAALPAISSAQQSQSAKRALGIDTMNFDRAVRPQDDFFRFVDGSWLARTEIPADASSWGAFNELTAKSRNQVHDLLEAAAKSNAPAGSDQRKVGDLYTSFLDSAIVESRGLAPLAPELAAIQHVNSNNDLPAAFAHFARLGVTTPFQVGVGQDPKASSVNIVQIGQSGLGLPDRSYYLRNDAAIVKTREAYGAYIVRLLTLAHQHDPAGAATRILELERAIATPQWDRAKSRDASLSYNKMTVAELAASTPSYDWHTYMTKAELGSAQSVIVRQPDYVKAMQLVLDRTPASTWREYLTFHLLDRFANELPGAYVQARFAFRDSTLGGQRAMSPRWKRAVAEVTEVQGSPGDAVGKLYVENYFPPAAKVRMEQLVQNLIEAYRVGIDSLEWMTPETRRQAQDKLAHLTVKIGYPDKWRDYSKLVIKRDDLLGNAIRTAEFRYDDQASFLGRPPDRSRWQMTPQTVDAYSSGANHEIVFPAGILQPPFFDMNADDAVNYGGIGAVIGHEIGHQFDDQGSKFDSNGNLRDWWTPADAAAFKERTQKLGAEYAAINPIDTLHINPGLTMGENIGDNSGLMQAYRAYRISLHGHPAPVIAGLTGDQRFFIGYAQIWRTKFRDAALRNQLLTNPHSPGMARAFVPLTNNDAFMKAFDVKPGDKMWRDPKDRVKIW
jgi:putative endopeptidase